MIFYARFVDLFGEACSIGPRHVKLDEALRVDLERVGVDRARIVSAGSCTACDPDTYYSYRAEGGICGRHGALAFGGLRWELLSVTSPCAPKSTSAAGFAAVILGR